MPINSRLCFAIYAAIFISTVTISGCATGSFQDQNGIWTGIGYQLDGSQSGSGEYSSWSVLLTTDDQLVTISYPSLNCGGNWQLESSTTLASYYRENITFGLDDCLDQVLVVVSPIDGGRLRLEYYYPDDTFLAFAYLNSEK